MPIYESTRAKAHELNVELSPRLQGLLGQHDEASQRRWLVNPLLERILNDIKWQVISNLQGGNYIPSSTTMTTTVTVTTSTTTSKKSEPEPEAHDSDSGEEIDLFDIFS